MTKPSAVLCLVLALGVAGCVTAPGGSPTPEPTGATTPQVTPSPAGSETGNAGTVTPTAPSETREAATTTGPATTVPATSGEAVTAEYVVRPGELPPEFESLTVTFAVLFASGDVHGCADATALLSGPEDPTPTPFPTPEATRGVDCVTYENLTVDLADSDGPQSLGAYSVPSSVAGEYALVVRDVVGTYENGTRETDIYEDDFWVHGADGESQRVGIEFDVNRSADRRSDFWRYETSTTAFDPGDEVESARYDLTTDGSLSAGEPLTIRVTRDGDPVDVPLSVSGAADEHHRTGSDGAVTVEMTDTYTVSIAVRPTE